MRGAAALAVVAHHAINYSEHIPSSMWLGVVHAVLDRGYIGVPLFFVISGFCIHLRSAARHAESGLQRMDYLAFWKRRLTRLYPPYVAALLVSMGLLMAAYIIGRHVQLLDLYPDPKGKWIGIDFLLHLAMLHGFHPIFDRAGGNPPFWTLAREEYFYIMYFALLAARRRVGAITTTVGVLLIGLIFPPAIRPLLPAGDAWTVLVRSSAPVLWFQWCLGMLAVESYYGLARLPKFCSAAWLIPLWGAAAIYADDSHPVLAPMLWGMTFFTLVNACVQRETVGAWPQWPIVRWLERAGVYSYSIYLIHNPVRGVLNQVLPHAQVSRPL